jgi:hypothetical protein
LRILKKLFVAVRFKAHFVQIFSRAKIFGNIKKILVTKVLRVTFKTNKNRLREIKIRHNQIFQIIGFQTSYKSAKIYQIVTPKHNSGLAKLLFTWPKQELLIHITYILFF